MERVSLLRCHRHGKDEFMVISKSAEKRMTVQKKNPRVPTFPPSAAALAQKLSGIIDAGGEHATTAYAALTRLCVMWTPGALVGSDMGGGNYAEVVNFLLHDMFILFPDGEGLQEDKDNSCPL